MVRGDSKRIIERCRELAAISGTSAGTCRTFLSPAMRRCYDLTASWMRDAGMQVTIDAAGNLRGLYAGSGVTAPHRLLIGSHLDTVENAGAFDGILGVMIAIEMVQAQGERSLPFEIEVLGFSEEEGVRFGIPFIGSRALAGSLDEELLAKTDSAGVSVAQAIRDFGLDPLRIPDAVMNPRARAYLEFHIEQGPVLDEAGEAVAVVESIAGQTRAKVTFIGEANHAGTTPMQSRRDALAGAAEWISAVEREAQLVSGMVATVGKIDVKPRIGNVIAGQACMSLDVRHAADSRRLRAVASLQRAAAGIAEGRRLQLCWLELLSQPATPLDTKLNSALACAVKKAGISPRRMTSGAGHDAMIMASRIPAAMLFLRSPGGISHHPSETVRAEDVEIALQTGLNFVDDWKP